MSKIQLFVGRRDSRWIRLLLKARKFVDPNQMSLFGAAGKPRGPVKAPGSRGGKFYRTDEGDVRYGERPTGVPVIVVQQSTVNGRWGYGPQGAMHLLNLHMDDKAPYLTSDEAVAAAKKDGSIPKGATIKVIESTPANQSGKPDPAQQFGDWFMHLQRLEGGPGRRGMKAEQVQRAHDHITTLQPEHIDATHNLRALQEASGRVHDHLSYATAEGNMDRVQELLPVARKLTERAEAVAMARHAEDVAKVRTRTEAQKGRPVPKALDNGDGTEVRFVRNDRGGLSVLFWDQEADKMIDGRQFPAERDEAAEKYGAELHAQARKNSDNENQIPLEIPHAIRAAMDDVLDFQKVLNHTRERLGTRYEAEFYDNNRTAIEAALERMAKIRAKVPTFGKPQQMAFQREDAALPRTIDDMVTKEAQEYFRGRDEKRLRESGAPVLSSDDKENEHFARVAARSGGFSPEDWRDDENVTMGLLRWYFKRTGQRNSVDGKVAYGASPDVVPTDIQRVKTRHLRQALSMAKKELSVDAEVGARVKKFEMEREREKMIDALERSTRNVRLQAENIGGPNASWVAPDNGTVLVSVGSGAYSGSYEIERVGPDNRLIRREVVDKIEDVVDFLNGVADDADVKEDYNDVFGDVISSYSRKQAIEDGELVDLTEWASHDKGFQGGFNIPVAVTRGVWADIQSIPASQSHQDERGRAHDVLWMASRAAARAKDGGRTRFQVKMHVAGTRKQLHTYDMAIGSGDNGEPVITIMREGED